jgi:L,D-transpeptidase YcbB
MHTLHRFMLSSALVVALWSPAFGNEPVASTSTEAVPAQAGSAATALGRQIVDALATTTRTVDDAERAALATFYTTPGRAALWTSDTGLNPRAIAVITEIRNAADWGLNAAQFALPEPQAASPATETLAAAEVQISRAVLQYARHARGGRIDVSLLGRNFDQKPPLLPPQTVLDAIATAPDAAAYLRDLHPRHPQFHKLREALLASRKPQSALAETKAPGSEVKLPAGPRLKLGQAHPHVDLLRQRLGIAAPGTDLSNRLDAPLQAALRAFQQATALEVDGTLNTATRAALNGLLKAVPAGDKTQRILVNMERWRWLPEDLGRFHVWDNIPEYRMRVLKDGQAVHSETIIVGKPSTPTPVFSADMKYVIFHPTWGVPDGIKMNEIAPALRRSSSNSSFWDAAPEPAILRRHNLIVSQNGRPVNPASVNWQAVDIRNFQFTQPASKSNVLGVVKFRFPNKHDVYMHDTPERELFSRSEKAFSHGCMRVQNPRRLAEVLLAEDKGWSSTQVGNAIAAGTTQDVTLNKQIPVHVTYFTAVVDDDGRLKTFGDLYGHDSRIVAALEGKPVKAAPIIEATERSTREVRRTSKSRPASGGGSFFDIFSGLSGN